MSRVSIVKTDSSERVVWISPVCARLNGWSGENRRAAEIPVLRARVVFALAFAAGAKGGCVRTAAVQMVISCRPAAKWRFVRQAVSGVSCGE
ncbi:hypothetical protein MWU63_02625 [Pseudohalocynthiibacter sp. F2068]|nr:hypothetical protein [Pseudohalocynthiibacter sp. F2068]